MGGYVVLANAHAGSVEREALDAAAGVLAAAGPTEVRMSSDPAALDAALTGLDGRVLVVAGGDGSIPSTTCASRSDFGSRSQLRTAISPA